MDIRLASIHDIPEIVSVLQASIGESKLPKSAEIWKFKHLDNPFGRSLVLVAVQETKIVGVRAFMKWQWQLNGTIYTALRAVDTGILPNFQRRGIFKALNMEALKLCRENEFIFNTPNRKSLKGNLKMGWEGIGKIRVKVTPGIPLSVLGVSKFPSIITKNCGKEIDDSLLTAHNSSLESKKELFTPKSLSYLRWRYEENPLQQYEIFGDNDFYLAAFLKDHKYFGELRIAEHIFVNDEGLKKIKSLISELNRNYRAEIVSYSQKLNLFPWEIKFGFGPMLIGRNLTLDGPQWQKFKNVNYWNYSLGDLELF